MTENLAGRGEGLAGLRRWANVGVNGLMQEHPLGEFILRAEALEAAAPAGTPDVFDFVGRKMATHLVETMGALEGFADPVHAAGQSALEEFWFRATGKHIDWDSLAPEVRAADLTAALATPSPQAPQEQSNAFSPTSAREQSSATASGNQGTGDGYLDTHLAGRIAARLDEYEFVAQMVSGVRKEDWFKRRIADLEARYKRAAATQEQPAGSAPSGSTRPNVYTIQEVSMGRRAKNCNCGETPCMCKMFEEEMKLEEAEQKEAETGSPRKVGEDGVGELKVGDVVLVEATISGVSRFEDGQVSGEDLLHLRVANGHGSIVRRCVARPSSVPVGEQKQEEGV